MSDISPPHRPPASQPAAPPRGQVLRFVRSERLLHWALAIPFVVLYLTAAFMFLLWGEAPPRDVRAIFSIAHKAAGVAFIVLPPLALTRGFREWRVHLENFREGWRWDRADVRWLLLMPVAAVNPKVVLPEQGKFNAAEKLNFMMVSATWPLYALSGVLIWMPEVSFTPWVLHLTMAVLGAGLVLGHIVMATVNPGTKVGLSGMITGFVDREWARHHYRRWYRERHERAIEDGAVAINRLALPAAVRCPSCGHVEETGSWNDLMRRAFQVQPLFCPACQDAILAASAIEGVARAESILQHVEASGGGEAYAPAAHESGSADARAGTPSGSHLRLAS